MAATDFQHEQQTLRPIRRAPPEASTFVAKYGLELHDLLRPPTITSILSPTLSDILLELDFTKSLQTMRYTVRLLLRKGPILILG